MNLRSTVAALDVDGAAVELLDELLDDVDQARRDELLDGVALALVAA
jgi:hypothetical protein